jgi:hypothetical protein
MANVTKNVPIKKTTSNLSVKPPIPIDGQLFNRNNRNNINNRFNLSGNRSIPQPLSNKIQNYSLIIISYIIIIGIIIIITEKYNNNIKTQLISDSLKSDNITVFYNRYLSLPIIIFVYIILVITFIYFLIFSIYIVFRLDNNSQSFDPNSEQNSDSGINKLFNSQILINLMGVTIIMFLLNFGLIGLSWMCVKYYKPVKDALGNNIMDKRTINDFQLYYRIFFYLTYFILILIAFGITNYFGN